MLNNATIVLSDRYDWMGEVTELQAAIPAQQESLQLTADSTIPTVPRD
jgi:hypothetical protein